ncbi:MAG TPA: acyl-CoA dehydrogenase family protein [Gammaproteobacteria bacterium]
MIAAPDPLDLYDLRSLLGDEERLVKSSVASFVDREVLPIIGRCFADQRFPAELVPTMAELGLLGATLHGYGCAGVSHVSYGLICEELERGDSSLRSFVSVQTSLVMACIDAYGTDEQKAHWLPAMSRGDIIGCFGLTEGHGGSDPASMKTRARRARGDWSISGAKQWITNGGIADVAIVWARTEEDIAAFLVETSSTGFARKDIEDKLSLRASNTAELFLEDVKVPEASRLPGAEGLKAALSCLDRARYGIAWGAVGAARACLGEALAYTAERRLFGHALAETQLIQSRLATAARKLTVAQLVAFRLGQLKERGVATPAQASLAKWNNVDTALEIARDCRDMLGAAGITTAHASMRHMLNLESVATYEGTRSIHELVVGRALTGHAAF